MKKALGQTVRDLKRGVNKKVLKVPGLERKVLDSTSNEAWGPHGSHLAEIAQASKNQAEFQMIMRVLWKRLSDTGKNWRHVYKALIVLEYLVANGSERVIDEIKEHAHQISTLSEFQYVDSSGRDQGINVRRKSQSLVFLVTDKERIQEVRQKASSSRDKYDKPGGYSSPGGYGDRYNEDNQTGYGKDDRYGRYGDSASRDGDRSDRESDARFSRDGSVEEDHQGDERSRNADRDSNHPDDDSYSSSRGSGVRPDDYSQDGRNGNRRYRESNPGDPPRYEEVASEGRTSVHSERGGDASVTDPRPASSPSACTESHPDTKHVTSKPPVTNDSDNFDEFDPRGSVPSSDAPAVNSYGAEMDLLGSLSDSFLPDNAAHIPTSSVTDSGVDIMDSGSGANFSATFSGFNQTFEDPFGDTPFKATPSTDSGPTHSQNPLAFQSTINQGLELVPAQSFPQADEISTFDYGTPFGDVSYPPSAAPHDQFSAANTQLVPSEFHDQETDILAGILPPSGFVASPSASLETPQALPVQSFQANDAFGGYHQPAGAVPPMASHLSNQSPSSQNAVMNNDFFSHQGFTAPSKPYLDSQLANHPHNHGDFGGDFFQQLDSSVPTSMPPNSQIETDSQKYGVAVQQSGSNMQATSSTAPESPFGSNLQQNGKSALSQNPSVPHSTSPVVSQGQRDPDAQNYNEGCLQHSASSVPVTSSLAPEPNGQHGSGGFVQPQSVQQVVPQVQNDQNPQNSNDAFFHQQYTSSAATGAAHGAPGFSYSYTGQQIGGGFLQQAGSSQRNQNLNPQLPASPEIASTGQKEQNHDLQSESASWTSQMGPGFSYAPNSQQNAGGFHQQPASSVGNSFTNPQQPNSMHMAPPDMKGQNLQHYSSGFPQQHPSSTASGAPLMVPTSTFPSNAQQSKGELFQQPGLSGGSSSVSAQGHSEWTAANNNGGILLQNQESHMVPGQSYSSTGQYSGGNFLSSSGSTQFSPRHVGTGTAPNHNSDGLRGIVSQRGPANQVSTSQPSASASVGPLALVPQPAKDKFETKSTVWADTLSRGLVNLNISGSKTNPLADIGIDFDAINRKEKRMEKPAATPVVSTVSMGKAMGSGSGIGRSGASALRPSASPMMNPNAGPGFGQGSSMAGYGGISQQPMGGFGGMNHQQPMGGYGVMNQPAMGGLGGMNQQQLGGFSGMGQQPMGMGFGIGMNMNMGQGSTMQQPTGFPPGPSYNGGYNYNPMMGGNGGGGGYSSQQPYGGGYQ